MFKPSVWRTLARLVFSVGAVFALAGWATTVTFLPVFQCSDNCTDRGPPPDSWPYIVQAVVALVGVAISLLAVLLGFTRHRSAYLYCVGGAVLTFLAWWYLVQSWRLY